MAAVWVMGCLPVGVSLIQGGFYPTIFLLAGVISAVLCFLQPSSRRLLPAELPFLGLALWTLLASLVNGYDASSLAQAALPLSAALFLSCYLSLPPKGRRDVLEIIKKATGLLAGLAILAYSGVFRFNGDVAAGRLQFPFQYANAAGTWYAAAAILSMGQPYKSPWTVLPTLTALFLTKSVGALGTYAIVTVVSLLKNRDKWPDILLIHALAVLFSVGIAFSRGFPAVVLILFSFAVSRYLEPVVAVGRRFKLNWVVLQLGTAAIVPVMLSDRISSAVGTFAERIVQIRDGAVAIASHPLFGLGADNWERAFTHYQTAQYKAAVMHSSIVELGLNGGLPAVVLFAAFLILAIRLRGRRLEETAAAVMLSIHGLLDFNLRFFPILALLLALIFAGAEAEANKELRAVRLKRAACVCSAVLLLFLGITKQLEQRIVTHAARGDTASAERLYTRYGALLGADRDARWGHILALYSLGQYEAAEQAMGDPCLLNVDELMLCVRMRCESGETQKGYELLLRELSHRLYDVPLFNEAEEYLKSIDAPPWTVERFNELAVAANEKESFLGNLMGNQEKIKQILQ